MKRNFDYIKKFEDEDDIEYFGISLGKGSYGEVREVKIKNASKMMACQIINKKKSELPGEISYLERLRGPNIVKTNKTIEKEIDNYTHELVILEKALFRDLEKLSEFYHNHLNLEAKLSDFSLLTKVKEKDKLKIPWDIHGYESPEYYSKELISRENAKKQDYFALGSNLYNLKYGKPMNGFKKADENEANNLISILSLHRNKWLNNNFDIIKKILIINESDEEKTIMEFQKSDFLIKMDKNSNQKQKKFRFKRKE
jgi:serine/threonine protein kinase